MPYFVYILYSKSTDQFYKGQTSDINERLIRHNGHRNVFTSGGNPWVLLWKIMKETRQEAIILEKKLKNLNREKLIGFMKKYNEGIVGPDELILLEQLYS
ncbi:MAG TPA: GIY-YIG nuclease family protein [Bacteroidia bacterium]|jgi:putative endonuclease|nr:GIY-YIG nuclease family protein [Bacteroidia bacterium]